MNDVLQTTAVVVIEVLALAWLVSRFWTRRRLRKPRFLTKPDVKASTLVRKNRPKIIRENRPANSGDQASRSDAVGRQGPIAPRWDRVRRRGAP